MKLSEQITPGPWGIYESPTMVYCDDTAGSRVADCTSEMTLLPSSQKKANAKAIAAVPEMLPILEKLAEGTSNTETEEARSSAIHLLNKLNS